MSANREHGCPACRHSMAGYHVAYPPSTSPSQPKATDENLLCVWCSRWCVKGGVAAATNEPAGEAS